MIREAKESEQKQFDIVATHPLQSWQWGEFRKKTGVAVTRLVRLENEKIVSSFQITWHKAPLFGWVIGYCPKSKMPNAEEMKQIQDYGKKHKALFIKFEPNEVNTEENKKRVKEFEVEFDLHEGKSLFTRFSLWLDIDKSEAELLSGMSQKTRYNVRLAEKKGVEVVEDKTEIGFEDYWKLMEETTKRQGFFAHTKNYHHKMWQTMVRDGEGHLFKAIYNGEVLTTWILFTLNGVLYYPYGASSNKHREVMASNAMMWRAIKFGRENKCKLFDMWGSLGNNPDTSDPWYGFHKFKLGFGSQLVEFLGTYDLVINKPIYFVYGGVDKIRWIFLKLLAKIR